MSQGEQNRANKQGGPILRTAVPRWPPHDAGNHDPPEKQLFEKSGLCANKEKTQRDRPKPMRQSFKRIGEEKAINLRGKQAEQKRNKRRQTNETHSKKEASAETAQAVPPETKPQTDGIKQAEENEGKKDRMKGKRNDENNHHGNNGGPACHTPQFKQQTRVG